MMGPLARRALFALLPAAPLAVADVATGREPSAMEALEQFVDKLSARRVMLGDLLDGKGGG